MPDNKIYLPPLQYDKAIRGLIKKIQNSNFKPDLVLGIARGGLMPAVYASHILGKIPMYSIRASEKEWSEFHIQQLVRQKLKTSKNTLVIDEISNTGAVSLLIRKYFDENYPNINFKFAVVYAKKSCLNIIDYHYKIIDNNWIVFPYEMD
jgi:uncharacterized protein